VIISSRTPEGLPHRCPICAKIAALEPCYPGGDSVCPSCGHLLWSIRDRFWSNLGVNLGVATDQITFETLLFDDLGIDSLDRVEFVMGLEEEFEFNIPDEVAENFRTVGDVIEYLQRR
jgi:acyl carrier protein